MRMPDKLQEAVEAELTRSGWQGVSEARQELTDRYRHQAKAKGQFMTKDAHRSAYLATRLPATYAACYSVLEEIHQRAPEMHPMSLLDLGAGPGTAMWAAAEAWPAIEQMTLLENDADLIELGKRLASGSGNAVMQGASWQLANLEQLPQLMPYDLITLSYSIGELSAAIIPELIQKCWEATKQFLVIIEPGTPQGFERIRAIRRQLIALGAFIVAPCPHANACPMKDGDWCHFAARVERSSMHRRLKGATLGHEDEKYSYIAVSKTPQTLPGARVLRHPMRRSGHVNLTLCTPEGLKQETISKRDAEAYKKARKTEWGSPF